MNEQLKIIISAEIDKLKQNVDNAKKEIKSFKEQVNEAKKNVDADIKQMGEGISSGLKTAGTAIAGASAALIALGGSTAEYRNEQAKLVTAFETAGGSAEDAKQTYNDLYRVLGDGGQATEAANHLAKLTTNQKELSEWTNICQGVYATFGDSIPIEGLTEAANETAKTGALTGSLADALNWAGISEDAFSASLEACNSEAEREALIRETLSGLYGEAAAKYEENNAQVLAQNESQAKLQDTLAALGETVAPIITAFTSFANEALAALNPYIQELGEKIGPALNDTLSKMGDLISGVFGFITEHWGLVLTIAGVIGGITAAIGIYNAVTAIKAAMDAAQVTTVWGLVSAHLAQAAAAFAAIAPYLLIVAAIAAVIAIIVLCVKYWDEIVAAVKKAVKFMVDAIGGAVKSIGNFFSNMWNGIKNGAKNAWQAVLNVFSAGGKIFSGIKGGIEKTFKSVVNTIIGGINKVIAVPFNAINNILGKIKGISIAGIKPFNWMWSLTVPQIPKLAKGGVIDGATLAMIGEQGKEAVVPLENNLQWLDKLASMLNDRMGGNTPIILQVDGKTFAQTAISTINNQTKLTGKLALQIV